MVLYMRIPRQIVVETSLKCNLKCTHCPSVDPSINKYGERVFMDVDFYKSIVDRIVKEKMNTSITGCLNGESLLHPNIYEMFKYTADKKIPFYITTNSSIWHEEVFQLATDDNSCYQIIMSNNGLFTPNSSAIEKCMPGIQRNKSKQNIERFIQLREKKGKENFQIGIKICKRGQDQEELEHIISYWLENGADFVIIGRILDDVKNGMRMFPCRHFDDMAMYIRADGNVVPCSFNIHMANEHAMDIGKLNETESLIKFYNKHEYLQLRFKHYTGEFPWPCSECAIAYTGDGVEGELHFRNPKLSQRTIYFHDDYSNTFYSYKPRKTRVSYLRQWESDEDIIKWVKKSGMDLNFEYQIK